MSKQFLAFHNVSFGYESSLENILGDVSIKIARGWTGVIGSNGSGKTTLLKLACGLLTPNDGSIERPANSYYNEQRTDCEPINFMELLQSYDKLVFQLIDGLQIKPDWIERWETLSHGERKRAQIACALFNQPDLLAIDEPTNHLDSEAKKMLLDSLKSYKGIGLLVSHDRELIEDLCAQFIFIDSPVIDFRRGKLSEVMKQRKSENDFALKQIEIKQLELSKLEKEYQRRSAVVEKMRKKSSKKDIDKKDHDAKAKIDLGRLTGKDAVGGKLKTRMQRRIDTAKSQMSGIEIKREYQTGIVLSDSVSKRNFLLNLEPGIISLSSREILLHQNLFIGSIDKIAVTGENGSGKSTLIKYIMQFLNAEPENITYIPQEISVDETKQLNADIKKLQNDQLGKLMIIVSRLGSDAKRLLSTEIPSPGETRKLLLGLGIAKNPHIIIMDEPTNHIDLVSIECLEDALKNVSCALLLVSHDKHFLDALTNKEWRLSGDSKTFEVECV